jgi:hypothetical protein
VNATWTATWNPTRDATWNAINEELKNIS